MRRDGRPPSENSGEASDGAGFRTHGERWELIRGRCEDVLPALPAALFDACIAGDWPRARELQSKISWLWLLFRDQYPSSLKGGMVMMGRPVGPTRAPLPTAAKERQAFIYGELERLGILATEPHGW